MATYYIDNINGNDALDGLSPETARRNYTDIDMQAGDTVLFRRGSFYRDILHAERRVSYGAYGEGSMPTFCGSEDISCADLWEQTGTENVWKCKKALYGDVGNIVFNESECTATLRWSAEELSAQGDFYDEKLAFGTREQNEESKPTLYIYSRGNPANVYNHIEAVTYGKRQLVALRDGMSFENLRFINSGVHGMAGKGNNITVRSCAFENIGGCYWSVTRKIRFGNAFEIWEYGDDILIESCTFKNVYDSCITHQGPGEKTKPAKRFICRGCTFDTYGMAAAEYRDKLPIESAFTGNICLHAGCGFAMRGEALPRNSEIWPLPMGHHIFLWRIEHASPGGSLEIKENYFGGAEVGAAVYSLISPEAEAQVHTKNNVYTHGSPLLIHWGAEDFAELEAYKAKTGKDHGSTYGKTIL